MSATGTTSPLSAGPLRPLSLSFGDVKHSVPVVASLLSSAQFLRDQFAASLEPEEENAEAEEPVIEKPIELVARFLAYLVGQGSSHGASEILPIVLTEFERAFLAGQDVHTVAAESDDAGSVIRAYYLARAATAAKSGAALGSSSKTEVPVSALLRAVQRGAAKLYVIFGGQGNSDEYFEELRALHRIYAPLVRELITDLAQVLQELVSTLPDAAKVYTDGLDVVDWLSSRESTPSRNYLVAAPVSVPLIGVIQLAHYEVCCRVLGLTPGEFRQFVAGATGHSQGIVTAACVARADTWEDWRAETQKCVKSLFFIGFRSQQVFPETALAPAVLRDTEDSGEGMPSPMLAVRELPKAMLDKFVAQTNEYLPEERHCALSLVNGPRSYVVSGPPMSLYGLAKLLRTVKADPDANEARVPYSQRKQKVVAKFLRVTVPFHSQLLKPATAQIVKDLRGVDFSGFKVPVYDTFDGRDLAKSEQTMSRLVELITELPVNWETATQFQGTHILEFGPGGASGLASMTQRNKEGSGVRVIAAGELVVPPGSGLGAKHEVFDRDDAAVQYALDWQREFAPKLARCGGELVVDTRFSRLLGRPPLMVAGMTPCTVHPSVVAATLNSGYHIEMAGGGYFMEPQLRKAFAEVQELTPAGITLNVLYVNPAMLQWCIPMVAALRSQGFPLDGLTIGAGVPSIEVANEYIRTLGLKHISFKPGTADAIRQCVAIAAANPDFPVVIQWTGGRGGGHHSAEDFHAPILQTYAAIRRQRNAVLVAGSGFGDAEASYPYLTGEWARRYDVPPMPFDGFLFGSRVMVAREFVTSEAAKQAIVNTPGVPDSEWEQTYTTRGGGGILTVLSEMGEPIHKLATRGVKLWKELDTSVFGVPRGPKRLAALQAQRDTLPQRLNADFQKPWFATANGKCVELGDLTYAQILRRLVETQYVAEEARWIDLTLRDMTAMFVRRTEERLAGEQRSAVLQSNSQLNTPYEFVAELVAAYPAAETQIVSGHDKDYFLELCLMRNHKPVPFVPALDENFEFWFKKDSLWQSEDLAAVGGDVGRTCILHGPVAAQYSTKADEGVGEILTRIHEGHVAKLLAEKYGGDVANVPAVEALSLPQPTRGRTEKSFTASPDATTAPAAWLEEIAGATQNWRYALLMSPQIMQTRNGETVHVDNALRRVLAPSPRSTVEVTPTSIKLTEDGRVTFDAECTNNRDISVRLWEHRTATRRPEALQLQYIYQPLVRGELPVLEVMEGRNRRIKEFYWRVWFGADAFDPPAIDGTWTDRDVVVDKRAVQEFVHAVGNKGEAHVHGEIAPLDFAIVVGWRAITRAIFPDAIDGDLLKLVHLSNQFTMRPGAQPLRAGDDVRCEAAIKRVSITPAGKIVEVKGTLYRGAAEAVVDVSSQFLYRGAFTDFAQTFAIDDETPVELRIAAPRDAAVLFAKEWFHPQEGVTMESLVGKTLTVRCRSRVRQQTAKSFAEISTTGVVEHVLPTKQILPIGKVEYTAGHSFGNPVVDFLARKGTSIEQPVLFEQPIVLADNLVTHSPVSNELYAEVSGDYNPIHVSRVFSQYAGLPGTITHGMYTSAAVRAQVEMWAASNEGKRMRAFSCDFVGMVLPNSELKTSLEHIGMINGRKIVNVRTTDAQGELVLSGRAEVEQPNSTYVFTGQGSQEQGMGMDLYASSAVARAVWDRADRHFVASYGISILDIVRNNPKTLTVHFGGDAGARIRENYRSMMFETLTDAGELKAEPIFPDIGPETSQYVFNSPNGVLAMTQFTQPALTLMEKAAFEDMKSRGLVDLDTAAFAGHSLGEYSALTAMADVMPVESLVDVVFYRGMTMQVAVPRDAQGRSNYGMCAVNPSRISAKFSQDDLKLVVSEVAKQTGWLLEIVNYNVRNQQYVAAGDLRALDTLTTVLNLLKINKIQNLSVVDEATATKLIAESAEAAEAKPQPISLERGFAVIPLPGISVPFHSSYLRSGVKPFKNFLIKRVAKDAVKPASLKGKYIPNLTAKPFEVTKEYFQEVYDLTGSAECKRIIDNWEEITKE